MSYGFIYDESLSGIINGSCIGYTKVMLKLIILIACLNNVTSKVFIDRKKYPRLPYLKRDYFIIISYSDAKQISKLYEGL